MWPSVQAGITYVAGVFAIGFVLGGIRLMLLAPMLGETWSVVVEIPVILGFSWVLCAQAISRACVPPQLSARTIMGVTAFVFLLLAEYLLWLMMFSSGSDSFLEKYTTRAGAIGLMGQIAFSLFPLIQAKTERISAKTQ